MDDLYGASHGIEVVFLFGPDAVSTLPRYARASDPDSWEELSSAMLAYWANFARTGDPASGGGVVAWAPWREEGARKIVFDSRRAKGIRMTDETVYIADLKKRLREDPAIKTQRDRCELHVQLFYYALSSDFWDEEEYARLGCAAFPPGEFSAML